MADTSLARQQYKKGMEFYKVEEFQKAEPLLKAAAETYLKARAFNLSCRTYISIGKIYATTQQLENAEGAYKKAIEQGRLAGDDGIIEYRNAFFELANLYGDFGKHYESVIYYDSVFAVQNRLPEKDLAFEARLYFQKGDVLYYSSQLTPAKECFEKSLEANYQVTDSSDWTIATVLNELSHCYGRLGNNDKAEELLYTSVRLLKKKYDPMHEHFHKSYMNLAYHYARNYDYEKALSWNDKAMELCLKNFGENHHLTYEAYFAFGAINYDIGNYEKAKDHFEKAETFFLNYKIPKTHRILEVYRNLSFIHNSLGNLETAIEYHKKIIALSEEHYGVNHFWTAGAYINYASVLDVFEQPDTAIEYIKKAIAICQIIAPEGHRFTAHGYGTWQVFILSKGVMRRQFVK